MVTIDPAGDDGGLSFQTQIHGAFLSSVTP